MSEKLAINGGKPVREKGLQSAYPGALIYDEEEKKAVAEVLERKSPYRFYGPDPLYKVKQFEKNFAEKTGCKYALGVTSGTASLVVALKAAGIGPGDKVIVPANTFVASPNAVIIAGAVPVFADVDETLNIDPDQIDALADKYTKAVMPVHIGGNPCDMDRVMEKAEKNNLIVIEDVAQSCGCRYKGRYAGTMGHIGSFSLQINKVITTGDGGVVATSDPKLYERAVRYHDQGMFREKEGFLAIDEKEDIFAGQNYRMPEISGAIACVQLEKLDRIIFAMRRMKNIVLDGIKDIEGITFRKITDPDGDTGGKLVMLFPDAETGARFREALNAENISCGYQYGGKPVYMIPHIYKRKTVDRNGFPFNQFDEEIVYSEGMCPVAEKLLPRNGIISFTPDMTERDAEDIAEGIRKVAKHLL